VAGPGGGIEAEDTLGRRNGVDGNAGFSLISGGKIHGFINGRS
jgi:hypothetical protein